MMLTAVGVQRRFLISLTRWGRDKMVAILRKIFTKAFSWIKMSLFGFQFCWRLFLRNQLTINQHWFRYWLGAGQATSHYLNQWWLVYWRIYPSLRLNELIRCSRDKISVTLQMSFSNAFSWTEILGFPLKVHWNLFSRVKLAINHT